MPRKAKKTEKSPLPFLEPPVRGARLQNVPEVRAALNPKEFFKETRDSSSSLNSWVSSFILNTSVHITECVLTGSVCS